MGCQKSSRWVKKCREHEFFFLETRWKSVSIQPGTFPRFVLPTPAKSKAALSSFTSVNNSVQIYLPISGIICIVYPCFLSWKSIISLTHQDGPTWELTFKLVRHDRTEAASGKVWQWPHLCGFALRSFWGIFYFDVAFDMKWHLPLAFFC